MVHLEHVFVYLGPSSLHDLCGSSFLSQYCGGPNAFMSDIRRLGNNCADQRENKASFSRSHLVALTCAMILRSKPLRKHEVTPSHEIYVNSQLYSQHGTHHYKWTADCIVQYLRWKCLDGVQCFDLWLHWMI